MNAPEFGHLPLSICSARMSNGCLNATNCGHAWGSDRPAIELGKRSNLHELGHHSQARKKWFIYRGLREVNLWRAKNAPGVVFIYMVRPYAATSIDRTTLTSSTFIVEDLFFYKKKSLVFTYFYA